MSCIQTLVTEHTSDLIDALHSADDQSLQIQFQRNTKLQILIERIKMCLERSCSGSARICHEHRSLHFHKSLSVQIFPDRTQDFGTLDKCIFYVRIHDQIHISLTVTQIGIRQPMELLREDLQTLRKQRDLCRMDRHLSGLCSEYFSLDSDHITHVKFLEIFICFLAHAVSCNVRLDIPLKILHITERGFSHHTLGHHTSCDGYLFSLQFLKMFFDLLAVM